MQASLSDFKNVYQIPSADGNRYYDVVEERGIWTCPCYMGVNNPNTHCRHVLLAMNQQLRKKVDYLAHRKQVVSHAQFDSVEDVAEAFTYQDSVEFETLSRLALDLAKGQGYVTVDCIRGAVNNQFEHKSCILGTVISSLLSRGLIRKVEYVKTSNKLTHRSHIGKYVLTEQGEGVI